MIGTDREQGLSTVKFQRHMLKGENGESIKSMGENESTQHNESVAQPNAEVKGDA
jgi:hypothetical protein